MAFGANMSTKIQRNRRSAAESVIQGHPLPRWGVTKKGVSLLQHELTPPEFNHASDAHGLYDTHLRPPDPCFLGLRIEQEAL